MTEQKNYKFEYTYMVEMVDQLYKSGLEGYVRAVKSGSEREECYYHSQVMTCATILEKDSNKLFEQLMDIKKDGLKKEPSPKERFG